LLRFRGAVALVVVLFVACIGDDPTIPVTRITPKPGSASRPPTQPQGPSRFRVEMEAKGSARRLLVRAVADLKRIRFWDDLTSHLYVLRIDSRVGRLNVPRDGHLADAYYTGTIDDRGAGELCDVMFFSTAITDDLARWRDFWATGRIAEPPPSLGNFYVSLLAHELAHCRHGPRGEPEAVSWEKRTREALRNAGIT
jgi:hypothetical protein